MLVGLDGNVRVGDNGQRDEDGGSRRKFHYDTKIPQDNVAALLVIKWPEASYGAPAREKVTWVCVAQGDGAGAEVESRCRPNPTLEIPKKSGVEGIKLIQVGLVVAM